MTEESVNLTIALARYERKMRSALQRSAQERRLTERDIRPGMQPDIAAALLEHGRATFYPLLSEVECSDVATARNDGEWRKKAVAMFDGGTSEWEIATELGVSQQAVKNLISSMRRRRDRKRIAREKKEMKR